MESLGIMTFRNKKDFDYIMKYAKHNQYKWASDFGNSPTFESIKRTLPNATKNYAIEFFFNRINGKKEMQYQTLRFYKRKQGV